MTHWTSALRIAAVCALMPIVTLPGQRINHKAEAKFADSFHKYQRALDQVVEEWGAFCKSTDRVLSQELGQSEPHCNVPTRPLVPTEVKERE